MQVYSKGQSHKTDTTHQWSLFVQMNLWRSMLWSHRNGFIVCHSSSSSNEPSLTKVQEKLHNNFIPALLGGDPEWVCSNSTQKLPSGPALGARSASTIRGPRHCAWVTHHSCVVWTSSSCIVYCAHNYLFWMQMCGLWTHLPKQEEDRQWCG